MSAMEHLFMQIFERKQWIEGQLSRQVESYGESLAYSILAEGKQPPSWLWTAGMGGFGYPDPKGLNREHLISGMLFPLQQTTTPSANDSTYSTLPTFMGNKVCQSNKILETCAPDKYISREHRNKAGTHANKLNPAMMEPKAVEASAEFDPSIRIQHSDARQRDQVIHFQGEENNSSHLRETSTKEDQVTRSGVSSVKGLKADNIRKSSAMRLCADNCKVAQSSSISVTQPDCPCKSSGPLKSLNCIDDGIDKGTETQRGAHFLPSVDLSHLSYTTTGNVVVDHMHPMSGSEVELELHGASDINSSLNMSSNVAFLPHPLPLVAPKKLLFDGTEEQGFNKNSCISYDRKNLLSSDNSFAHQEVVQPANKDLFLEELENMDDGDLENVNSFEKDVLQQKMEVCATVSSYSREKNRLELLEAENSEIHSDPTSGNLHLQEDLLWDSVRSLPDVPHDIRLEEVLLTGVDYMPPEICSRAESNDPATDSCKTRGLKVKSSLEEAKGSVSDIAFNELKVMQSGKEMLSGRVFPADVSSINSQIQEDVLANIGITCGAEEASASSEVLASKLKSCEALKLESVSLTGSNNKYPDIPAVSYLKTTSSSSQSSPTSLSTDADCRLTSGFDFLGQRISILDRSNDKSLKTFTKNAVEEGNKEKIMKDMQSSPIQLTNIVQNAALSSQADNVPEAEPAAVGVVKSILHSTGIPSIAGTDARTLDFQHGLQNSNCKGDKNCGSCKLISASPSSDAAAMCLSDQYKSNQSIMDYEELSVAEISGDFRSRTESEVPFSLRGSSSFSKNLGSCLGNGPERNKDEISVSPEVTTAKPVNHNWVTPNCTDTQGVPTRTRYFLRSLGSHDMSVGSSRPDTSSCASCLRQGKEHIPHKCEISWPKRRKVEYRSNNILATSPRLRFMHSPFIKEGGHCSYKKKSGFRLEFQPISLSAETKTGMLNITSDPPSATEQQSEQHCTIEGSSYLNEDVHTMLTALPSKHSQEEILYDMAGRKLQGLLKDETKISEPTICECQKISEATVCKCQNNHHVLGNFHDSPHGSPRILYTSKAFTKDDKLFEMSSHIHDISSSTHNDSGLLFFDETIPEFEGFSIVFPSFMEDNSIPNDSKLPPLSKEQDLVPNQLYRSRNVLSPISCTSLKNKIHKIPDVYQSLPAGLLEHMTVGCSLHSNDANMNLLFDEPSVGKPYSHSLPFSSTGVKREVRKPPLTPPFVKFGQKVVSSRSGASPEVGSNPELICFRIDENSSIADENRCGDQLYTSEEDASLRQSNKLTDRKPFMDVTAEYHQESPLMPKSTRGSLESINSESFFRTQMSAQLSRQKGFAGTTECNTEGKENEDLTVNKKLVRKPALSLRNRSTRPRVSGKINERSRSHGNLEKGCKPSNLVSNISSFIPVVRQKRQAAPLKGRKDIKVKALEAAEAAKRLEEQKQNEREMRKAAAKLERKKLEQERHLEVKQKQKEEEKKKKDAGVAARKRQGEQDERRDKERKRRRCVEEPQRQKRKQEEKSHPEKIENKGERESIKEATAEEAKGQLKSERAVEVVQCQGAAGIQQNINKALAVDDRSCSNITETPDCSRNPDIIEKVVGESNGMQEILQKRICINKDSDTQSYDMSPYRDSDDEDGEEEIRREKKCIPLWARTGCVDRIILSKQHIDPTKIFSRKCSFILNEVLPTRVLRQPF